jgi:hypothetical protein
MVEITQMICKNVEKHGVQKVCGAMFKIGLGSRQ